MVETVSLSDGRQVTIRELTWGAYKKLKTAVLEQILQNSLSSVLAMASGGDFRGVAGVVMNAVSQIDSPFLAGCVEPSIDLDELPLNDMAMILAASRRVNPVEKFLELEKNSPSGGLLLQALKMLQESGQSQAQMRQLIAGGLE